MNQSAAPKIEELVNGLALVLGEHMHDGGELQVTYDTMQFRWQEHYPRTKSCLIRRPEAGWIVVGAATGGMLLLDLPSSRS